MDITHVTFNNFKPYYGEITIDLSVDDDKNIVLIGGRNGQGKTSFLVGVVWCLYGNNISTVDKVFKDEVKGNYTKFLSKSLNKTASSENISEFSVEIGFKNVELADVFTKSEQQLTDIVIKRTYDLNGTSTENFEILMDGEPNALLSDDSDKANFINDYIIPIELAKFVFFDAEKIAEIAQLGAKDQASLMDEAFGQVLGLNIYGNLVEDLKQYERNLQKEAASSDISLQIKTFENEKVKNQIKYEEAEKNIDEADDRIEELKTTIADFNNQLIRRGDSSLKVDLDALRKNEEKLNEQLEATGKKFNELSDIIPFAIMANKIEEVNDQIRQEEEAKLNEIEKNLFTEKTKEFTEQLFNRPDFPKNDIDLEQKVFYSNKAKSLLKSFSIGNEEAQQFEVEHDLDKSEVKHLQAVNEIIRRNSIQIFEGMFNEYMRVQNDFQEITKKIKMAESSSKDEFIQDIYDNKNAAERERDNLIEENGKWKDELLRINDVNKEHQRKIDNLLAKVKVSKKMEKQMKVVKKYLKVLNEFIKEQKEQKKKILEKSLVKELGTIMNKKGLVDKVELIIHKNNLGLEVKLFDDTGKTTNPSTDMSKGEQQLYISALLKAILSESIHELPVLIDTPLGRLDQEHRNNILKSYYPHLSKQVIIFSTNTEIRIADLPKIEEHLSKTYVLENVEKKTTVKPGYFA